MDTVREQATYYRAALLLGLTPGQAVVSWANGLLDRDAGPRSALAEVARTAPGDLGGLRRALQPLAASRESTPVLLALLARVWRDLASGRRSVRDSLTVLSQARRALVLPPALVDEIDTLQDDHMLATAGVAGDLRECGERLRVWLARFDGAGEPIPG